MADQVSNVPGDDDDQSEVRETQNCGRERKAHACFYLEEEHGRSEDNNAEPGGTA